MALSSVRVAKTVPTQDALTETKPVGVWAASTAYVVGQIVRSSAESGNYYMVTAAGTSGASAPTWTTTGVTVSDSGVTWQDIGVGNAGDPVQMPNGLAGIIVGLQGLPNQNVVTFSYSGVVTAVKATGVTAADGAAIWYDTANKTFVASAPSYGFYCGTARGAWVSGVLSGLLLLNGPLATTVFAGGALTLTGAFVAQSTLALTGAATLSSTLAVTGASTFASTIVVTGATTLSSTLAVTGATTLTGLLTANGGITMGGKLALTASNTPVAAAGSTYANATAVGTQDVITISSDSAAKGVKLLTGVAGQVKRIINTTATACLLYPATGGTLSGLAANAGVTIAASHVVIAYCVAADTWYVEDAGALLAA